MILLVAGTIVAVSAFPPIDYSGAEWATPPLDLFRVLLWAGMGTAIVRAGAAIASTGGVLHRLSLFLGASSYSIYLVHNAVVLVMIAVARRMHLALATHDALTVFTAATILLAILGGMAVHLLVEVPLIRLLTPRRKQAVLPVGATSAT